VGIHAQNDLSPITQTPDLLGLCMYSDQPAQSLSTDGLTERSLSSRLHQQQQQQQQQLRYRWLSSGSWLSCTKYR